MSTDKQYYINGGDSLSRSQIAMAREIARHRDVTPWKAEPPTQPSNVNEVTRAATREPDALPVNPAWERIKDAFRDKSEAQKDFLKAAILFIGLALTYLVFYAWGF